MQNIICKIQHLGALAILAILAIWMVKWFGRYWSREGYDAIQQLRQTQAKVDAMDAKELKECPTNAGFAETCKLHRSCCQDNAVGKAGCLCQDPVLDKCRSEYNDCRRGHGDSAMSGVGVEFVGAKAARGDMCQTILDNCCQVGAKVYSANLATGASTMTPMKGMKPVIEDSEAGLVCSQVTDSRDSCRDSCAANPKCHIAYRDELAGVCELYGSSIIKKKNTNEMMADNGFRMWTKGNVTELPPDVFEGFFSGSSDNKGQGRDMVSRCFNSIGINGGDRQSSDAVSKCQHPVIAECSRLHEQCVDKYSELLGDKNARDMCAKNHNACCQTLKNIDLGARFALDGPVFGVVNSRADMIGDKSMDSKNSNYWMCDISQDVKSLSECQKRCLEDPRCQILDSNMAIYRGVGGMNLAKLPPPKCIMHGKGTNMVNREKLGKPKIIGEIGQGLQRRVIYGPKNIWKRRVKDVLDDDDGLDDS